VKETYCITNGEEARQRSEEEGLVLHVNASKEQGNRSATLTPIYRLVKGAKKSLGRWTKNIIRRRGKGCSPQGPHGSVGAKWPLGRRVTADTSAPISVNGRINPIYVKWKITKERGISSHFKGGYLSQAAEVTKPWRTCKANIEV